MSQNTTDWTELREFRAVELTESFVLSWEVDAGDLHIDLDLCLLPDHAFYEKPRPREKACIHAALLRFPALSRLVVGSQDLVRASPDETAAALRSGRITGLRRIGDGRYEMQGTFGTVEIHAQRPILRLKAS